jgi:hypothetical protein
MVRFSLTLLGSLAAVAIAAAISFMTLAWVRGTNIPFLPSHANPRPLNSPDIYDLARSTVAVAGLAAGVFAAVYAYRKQRVEEASSRRADEEHLSSRYQDAAEQLGNDKAAVRLAGVYALARLADDWPEQRQTCIDVLCAYFRMHKEQDEFPSGEREVRKTIIDILLDKLEPEHTNSWRGYTYSLKDSYFDINLLIPSGPGDDHLDFAGSTFANCRVGIKSSFKEQIGYISFEDSTFKEGTRLEISGYYADGYIGFDRAKFSDGRFDLTSLTLDGAKFSFSSAEFTGAEVFLSGTKLKSGVLDFTRARFESGRIDFNHAKFDRNVATFGYAIYGSAILTFEDVVGEKPHGLPKEKWKPKEVSQGESTG